MGNQIQVTAPVTPELLAVLIDTEKFMAQYNDPSARLKDAEHYGAAAVQLEALVTAIMIAQTRVDLLGRSTIGARFHAGVGIGVMRSVDSAATYLATIARDLLRNNQLSRYDNTHMIEVLGLMSELMGRLTGDIQNVANKDLGRIRGKSVELLAATADVVAKIEGGDAASLAAYAKGAGNLAQDDNNARRCPVMLPGKGRCTKRVGHLAGPNQTDCTAN